MKQHIRALHFILWNSNSDPPNESKPTHLLQIILLPQLLSRRKPFSNNKSIRFLEDNTCPKPSLYPLQENLSAFTKEIYIRENSRTNFENNVYLHSFRISYYLQINNFRLSRIYLSLVNQLYIGFHHFTKIVTQLSEKS